jgi:hypothetical protein
MIPPWVAAAVTVLGAWELLDGDPDDCGWIFACVVFAWLLTRRTR